MPFHGWLNRMNVFHQFEVHALVPLSLWGYDVSFTNASLWMVIAAFLAIAFLVGSARSKGVLGHIGDMWVDFMRDMTRNHLGTKGDVFAPFVASIFLFILLGNLVGLIPYSFTFTSQLWVTFTFSISVFAASIIMGFVLHGWHFLTLFCPSGVPGWLKPFLALIELISFFSRPVSLAVRLFANMVAGHVMLKIFASFVVSLKAMPYLAVLPFALNMALMGFEVLVAVLQAYVFAILTCIYWRDALFLHGEEHHHGEKHDHHLIPTDHHALPLKHSA